MKTKRCLFIFIFVFVISSEFAQTNIPEGNVAGNWLDTNSPYYINGEITIPNGDTLTIEPGVEVIFTGHYKFNIQGQLLAIGTKKDTITFTAQDTITGWNGLRFDRIPSTNDTSKIIYCKLQYVQAVGVGGAIHIENFNKLIVSNCLITKNKTSGDPSSGGAGIVIVSCSPTIESNMISYNIASGGHGGGLQMSYSYSIVKNNIISKNESTAGAAVTVLSGKPVLINNTIVENKADIDGGVPCHGGAMCIVSSSPLFFNNIIHGNKASIGNQVHLQSGSQPAFLFCNIEGSSENFARDGHNHGSYSGTYISNIITNPLFMNLASDDYRLSDNSPCIGAGSDSIVINNEKYYAPQNDYEGNTRPDPVNSTPDIGALENIFGKSSDGWIQTNVSVGGTVNAFAVNGTSLFAGTSGSGVFLSTNFGDSWTAVNEGLTNSYIYALTLGGNNLFAGTDNGVFISGNNGTSWSTVNTGLTDTNLHALIYSEDHNLFAGTSGGVFLSTNNGTSWDAVNIGLTNLYARSFAIYGSTLFVGIEGTGIFLTTNNGTNWTEVNSGLTNTSVESLAAIGSNIFAGTFGGGVFRSTNYGTNWTATNAGLTSTSVLALIANDNNLFAGTTKGVFLSTNNGTSWTSVNKDLTDSFVFSLVFQGSYIFAGTPSGVWRYPVSEIITSVEKHSANLPMNFILYQNYPNPFNPSTKIQYAISSRQCVNLKIYDILGKEIATLVNEEKPVGTYEVIWNAVNLPSGVYFYQLKAGNFTSTKKLLLLK